MNRVEEEKSLEINIGINGCVKTNLVVGQVKCYRNEIIACSKDSWTCIKPNLGSIKYK